MNRVLACVFLSVGSVLVIYGLNALPSLGAAFSRLRSGGQPDQALWFLLAGTVAVAVGVVALFRAPAYEVPKSSRGHSVNHRRG